MLFMLTVHHARNIFHICFCTCFCCILCKRSSVFYINHMSCECLKILCWNSYWFSAFFISIYFTLSIMQLLFSWLCHSGCGSLVKRSMTTFSLACPTTWWCEIKLVSFRTYEYSEHLLHSVNQSSFIYSETSR